MSTVIEKYRGLNYIDYKALEKNEDAWLNNWIIRHVKPFGWGINDPSRKCWKKNSKRGVGNVLQTT